MSGVTGREEAGDVGRSLKDMERGPGFLPRTPGSPGEVVRQGQVYAAKGGKETGQESREEVKWIEGGERRGALTPDE